PSPRSLPPFPNDALPIFNDDVLHHPATVACPVHGVGDRITVARGADQLHFYRSAILILRKDGGFLDDDLEIFRGNQGLGIAIKRSEEHTSELQSRENLVC